MSRLKPFQKLAEKIFAIPWYPVAISAYPILALISANAGQIKPQAGIRALLASMFFGGLVFFALRLMFRQTHRAAFLTALWLGLFFGFGHAYIYLDEEYPDAGYTLWLLIGWGMLFALTLFWATRKSLNFISAAPAMNVLSAALILLAVGESAATFMPRSARALGSPSAPVDENLSAPENPPDVYYFILDSYARADMLQVAYDYDNSAFVKALEQRGFYVAACSQSNYVRTDISMTSALNMAYLHKLNPAFTPESTKRAALWDSLKHSAVRYNFERMGYQIVNFETGYPWGELDDADLFITPPPISSGMTEFEGLFLDTTLARYIKDWGWIDPDAVMGQTARDRFNNVFDNIPGIARMPGAQFNYIHLISPHPPFVFEADGKPSHPAAFWDDQRLYPTGLYTMGYLNQLQFLNRKMLTAIDIILAEADTPPIIVIQGDHGPWMQPKSRQTWILNAYYLPGHKDLPYPTITPVNTFRLIFNAYFGGNYQRLNDVSYHSPVPKIYNFSIIPNNCK